MIKGTTPTLHYNLPFSTEVIKEAEIVVEYVDSNKKIQIVRKMEDCIVGENCISTSLSQEETIQIPAPSIVHIQLRVLTVDELVFATEVHNVSVKRLLSEEVIE